MPRKKNNQKAFWIILALAIAVILFGGSAERFVRADQPEGPTPADLAGIRVSPDYRRINTVVSENFNVTGYRIIGYTRDSQPIKQKLEISVLMQLAKHLEYYKKKLSFFWFKDPNPANFDQKVSVTILLGEVGAGGATSFLAGKDAPRSATMNIQGSLELLQNSVIPHEVQHLVWAQYLQVIVPRWLDEGSCTTVECYAERKKHADFLIKFLTTEKGIPLNVLFTATEYPRDILTLYSQGASLTEYLLALGGGGQAGRDKLVAFIGDYIANMKKDDPMIKEIGDKYVVLSEKTGRYFGTYKTEEEAKEEVKRLQKIFWTNALKENYGINSISELQLAWVAALEEERMNEYKGPFPLVEAKNKPVSITPPPIVSVELEWERVQSDNGSAIIGGLRELNEKLKKLEDEKEMVKAQIEALEAIRKTLEPGSG